MEEIPRLIGPPPRTTAPADQPGTPRHAREVPEDLLRDASRRLGIMSLLGAALWSVGTVLYHLAMIPLEPAWASWQSSDYIASLSALASLALYWYTRRPNRDPYFILDLGLAHLVWTGIALGLLMHWDPVPMQMMNVSSASVVDWRGDADVCRDRAEPAVEDAAGRRVRGVDESDRHARRRMRAACGTSRRRSTSS